MKCCSNFFDLSTFDHGKLFKEGALWQPLLELKAYMDQLTLGPERILIGEGTCIGKGVSIEGPCVIGKNCEIRHGAYIRPYTLIGDGCVIGHASEVKNSIFLGGAKAPHFNYVGDSILGKDVNLGAGVKLANYRLDGKEVKIKGINTGLIKLGAILGDGVQLGCNSVTNPGCVIHSGRCFPPGVVLHGVYET